MVFFCIMMKKLKRKNHNKRKIKDKVFFYADKLISFCLILTIINLCFPQYSLAFIIDQELAGTADLPITENLIIYNHEAEQEVAQNHLPITKERAPWRVVKLTLTAYTSTPEQTDGNPCRTASGLNLCDHNEENIIATNYYNLPFGTRLKIPELFGDRVFIVQDRMHPKFRYTMDIWMKDRVTAIKFGRKWATVEIY